MQNEMDGESRAARHLYRSKGKAYFSGARADFVSMLPTCPDSRILEIGCGEGDTGALALSTGVCSEYHAVELQAEAARVAEPKLSQVLVGSVETMDLPWPERHFDGLIMSEVLEHLIDPWGVLQRIRPLMKRGATILASTPNVSHYRVILMLLKGDWKLTDSGIMDRTHLRWFTPRSFREMFDSTGYVVERVESTARLGPRARLVRMLTFGLAGHLLIRQMTLRARVDLEVSPS